MRKLFNHSLFAVLLAAQILTAQGEESAQTFSYQIKIHIEPSSSEIKGEVKIQNPPSSCFYLNGNLEIHQIIADGENVPFHLDSSKSISYTVGTAVTIDADSPKNLLITYTGSLSEVIYRVNMVTPDLVELALYSAWYPIFERNRLFDYKLDVNLPSSFITVTNGFLENQIQSDGRNQTSWTSFSTSSDIVILSSPHLKKKESNKNGIQIETYFSKLPEKDIDTNADLLIKSFDLLSGLFGPPRKKGLLRNVISPRSGWGYSRVPLFVVGEKYMLGLIQKEFGSARAFHGSAHEMAHFWWSIVDTQTPNDWINEGLAEFSAFRLSREYFGQDFADILIEEYQKHAAESRSEDSIAETKTESPDRYVNRYEKTTLFLIELEHRFGQIPLNQLLKSMHTRFSGTHDATTAIFLEEAEKHLGVEGRAFISEALYRKPKSQ